MEMAMYLKRTREALDDFNSSVASFASLVDADPASLNLPQTKVKKVQHILADLPSRAERVRNSLMTAEKTAADITDLQSRLEGESASLASALANLGDTLESSDAPSSLATDSVCALEERAKRVAMALFPNAIQGIRDINRTLWNFRLIALQYDQVFADEVAKNRLTAAQLDTVRKTANNLKARFDAVNDLLNQLTMSRQGDAATVRSVVKQARRALADAVKDARARDSDVFKSFRGVLGASDKLANDIDGKFDDLRVPVFPSVDGVSEVSSIISQTLYDDLSGVQRMALLNISSRLRSIAFGSGADDHLLSRRFELQVFDVFPDRIYFTVDKSFIETIGELQKAGMFEKAPASLHKFRGGSYKQIAVNKGKVLASSKRGNLQVSYQEIAGGGASVRFNVDADIDLYRSPLRHLFGEVLVNHLTGSTTDQFKVFDILAKSEMPTVRGFDIINLA
jgi:hypothetical protein